MNGERMLGLVLETRIVVRLGKALIVVVALICAMAVQPLADDLYVRYHEPSIFSYEELVAIGKQDPMPVDLAQKVQTLRTTRFISNEAYYAGARPRQLEIARLGRSLRVVMWNIERGLQLDLIKTLLTDKTTFMNEVEQHPDPDSELAKKDGDPAEKRSALQRISQQVDILQSADVLLLNEVDWGMKRTGYRAVVKELGQVRDRGSLFRMLSEDPMLLREFWIALQQKLGNRVKSTIAFRNKSIGPYMNYLVSKHLN
jgi:hypothetical protein